MPKYFESILDRTEISTRSGAAIHVAPEFHILSSSVVSKCSFLQDLIQRIIYTFHGPELTDAGQVLKTFPNPRARVDFLCSFPYPEQDPVVSKVFDFARRLFKDLYQLRNILSHETWASSEDYRGAILFSEIDENARLLVACGKLWHKSEVTPQDIYDATVRFIRRIKIVHIDHLHAAVSDIDLCNWSLMNIDIVLNESDPKRRDEARRAFLIFRGTSHLFGNPNGLPGKSEFSSARENKITQTL